jgi:hypothetical protein
MPKYTLLLRESGSAFANLSPQEMQAIVGRYASWSERLKREGRLHNSQKLRDGSGRTLRRSANQVSATDGPYSEAKEVIGGLYVIEADSFDDAARIAETCPHLDFGTVEVREVEISR